jgi:hypothetical protein
MNWRAGVFHPTGLIVLVGSLLLTFAGTIDGGWAGREAWLFLWGLASFAAIVCFVARRERAVPTPANPSDQIMKVAAQEAITPAGEKDFEQAVEAALRHISAPGTLVNNPLMTLLPRTIGAAWRESGKLATPTPLEKAQLLRSILEASIERLKPSRGEQTSNQYIVLFEHYLSGRPAAFTMTRHDMTERTYYRHQSAAIRAVATDLMAQEAAFAAV